MGAHIKVGLKEMEYEDIDWIHLAAETI